MTHIMIQNFGPITKLDMDLDKPFNIIIGPQASGKSTLAKIIYFCRKIRDYLVDFLSNVENFTNIHVNELDLSYWKFVRKNFMGCFGTTKHLKPFKIKYIYDTTSMASVFLSLGDDGYVRVEFDHCTKASIHNLISHAYELYIHSNETNVNSLIYQLKERTHLLAVYRKQFQDAANKIFYDDSDLIYIPAGRSVLSTLSEQLADVNVSNMDLLMQDFIGLIRITRNVFNCRPEEFVANYTKTIKGQINNTNVALAISLMRNILKGDYVCDREGEKIFYNDTEYVKLMYASSGQQESLWLLMLMLSYILNKKKVFLVIEEPEAHLFPIAQKSIVSLVALLGNASDNEIILTTHSPYILTSINLLLQSHMVENSIKGTETPIIPRQCRLNFNKLNAWFINNQDNLFITDITDQEMQLIDPSKIDSVSDIINEESEKLLQLKVKYDLY